MRLLNTGWVFYMTTNIGQHRVFDWRRVPAGLFQADNSPFHPFTSLTIFPVIVLHVFVCPCFGNHHGWFSPIRALSQHKSGATTAHNWMQNVGIARRDVIILIRNCRTCMFSENDNELNDNICSLRMPTADRVSSSAPTEHPCLCQFLRKVNKTPIWFSFTALYLC